MTSDEWEKTMMKTLLYILAAFFIAGTADRLGISNGRLAVFGGCVIAVGFIVGVLGQWLCGDDLFDSDSGKISDFGGLILVFLFCGAMLCSVAAARALTNRLWPQVPQCECGQRGGRDDLREPDADGAENGSVRGRLAPVAFGLVDAAAVEGDPVRDGGRREVTGARAEHFKQPGLAEFAERGFAARGVAGDGRAVAGGVAEDGELDVVHAAESTTGTDKLSAAAKGAE